MSVLSSSRSTPHPARRRLIAYAALLGVCLGLMALSGSPVALELQRGVSFAFAPVQGLAADINRGVRTLVASIGEIEGLRASNADLTRRNQQLLLENARVSGLEHDVAELTALLELKRLVTFKSVAVEVTGRDFSELRRVVTIGSGTDAAIEPGDVVIAAGGALVGRVTDVGPNFAHILLINDGSSTVVGQVQGGNATGEIVGQLGGVLVMNNVDAAAKLQIGDTIVTAGIVIGDGVRSPYPKGLLIGEVVDVLRDPNAVVQTAYVQPLIDLEKPEYLLVITDYEGGIPGVQQIPTDHTNPDGTLPEGEQPYVTPVPGSKR